MARKRNSKNNRPIVHAVTYVDPGLLKKDPSNPRKITTRELQRLATNIAKFGFVESVTACMETNVLIGGHQRIDALKLLMSGEFVPTEKVKVGGELVEQPIEHDWVEGKKVPVVYVEGLSKDQVKRLNMSLNKIGGEWDYEKVTQGLADIYNQELDFIGDSAVAIELMLDTGFMATEIADFLDGIKTEARDDGMAPEKTTGVPKLTLEFTNVELRDAFKAFVAECQKDGVPSGNALAEKLGVEPLQSRKRKRNPKE